MVLPSLRFFTPFIGSNTAVFGRCSDAYSRTYKFLFYHAIGIAQPPPLAQFGSKYVHYRLQRLTIWRASSTYLAEALRTHDPKIAGTANFYSLVCWTWYYATRD